MDNPDANRNPTAIRQLVGLFHSAREYLNPLLTESKFKESGVITPEEFIACGDFLVYKFPTWSWASGIPGKRKDYLPENKQYLVTRNVPCLKRVKAMEYTGAEEDLIQEGDEDWVATHAGHSARQVTEIEDMEPVADPMELQPTGILPNLDDIPDMDDFGNMEEIADPAAVIAQPLTIDPDCLADDDRILKTRYAFFQTHLFAKNI